jgi:hypothetical protein
MVDKKILKEIHTAYDDQINNQKAYHQFFHMPATDSMGLTEFIFISACIRLIRAL